MQAYPTPSAANPILQEAVRRPADAWHPERVYLFGSAARGDAGPDSDYDFMVIVPDNAPLECRNDTRAYLAICGLGIPKDVLVWTKTAFEQQLHLKAALPSTIVREGRLLYGG